MRIEVETTRGTYYNLGDGDESNPAHVDQLRVAQPLVKALDRYLSGFTSGGKFVLLNADEVVSVTVLEA